MAVVWSGSEKFPNPFKPRHIGISVFPYSKKCGLDPHCICQTTPEGLVVLARGNQNLGAKK